MVHMAHMLHYQLLFAEFESLLHEFANKNVSYCFNVALRHCLRWIHVFHHHSISIIAAVVMIFMLNSTAIYIYIIYFYL